TLVAARGAAEREAPVQQPRRRDGERKRHEAPVPRVPRELFHERREHARVDDEAHAGGEYEQTERLVQRVGLGVGAHGYARARESRRRSASFRSFLRSRTLAGVTSTSSSSSMNSSACSSENLIGGVRMMFSSEPAARMLVSCLPFV